MIARGIFLITAGAGLAYGLIAERIFIAFIAGWLLFAEFSAMGRDRTGSAGPIPEFSYDQPPEGRESEEADVAVEDPEQDPGQPDR